MSSQTPRRLSLRRKRQCNDDKANNLPSTLKEEVPDHKNHATDKLYKDKAVLKNNNKKFENTKIIEITTNNSGKKPLPPSTPTHKQNNGFSSTPISSRRNSYNSKRLLALQSSAESRTQQFSSPDSPFICSQLPCTQDCEVVWDCNSPGFSKDELKRLNANLVTGKTPSPKVSEILHPNRTLFNLNRPNTRSRRENCSNKSNGIVAELDNLLIKVHAEELITWNDPLSEDEDMPEALKPSGILQKTTQPFDTSILNEEVSVSQIFDKKPDIYKVCQVESNIISKIDCKKSDIYKTSQDKLNVKTTKSDYLQCNSLFDKPNEHLNSLGPIYANCQNKTLSEEAEMSDDEFDNAILDNSSLNNIINNIHCDSYNKSSVGYVCKDESSVLDTANAYNVVQKDSLNSTTDFEDDDLFSDSLLLCSQELENALYNKTKRKYNSTLIDTKGMANPCSLLNNDYLMCKANRTSFQLGLPIVSNNKNYFIDSRKSSYEPDGDIDKPSSSDLLSSKRNFSSNTNRLCNKRSAMNINSTTVGTLTRSMSANSNNTNKDLSVPSKCTEDSIPLRKHFSTNSPLTELGSNAKNLKMLEISNCVNQFATSGLKCYSENYELPTGSSALTKQNTGLFKLGHETAIPKPSRHCNNDVQNSTIIDSSHDTTSVFKKGNSEEDNDDEFFASLIPLVEKEEKSYANLAHCIQDSSNTNVETKTSLIGSNVRDSFHIKIDNKKCSFVKNYANDLKSSQSLAPLNSGKQSLFMPIKDIAKQPFNNNKDLEKIFNKTVDKSCDNDFKLAKKKLEACSKNNNDVSKSCALPSASKVSRSTFNLKPLTTSSNLFNANSICAGIISSKKSTDIDIKNNLRRNDMKGDQSDLYKVPLPSKLATSVEIKMKPNPSQNDSDSFDDEDDFFDEDVLHEISFMESQVQSFSQSVKPSLLATKTTNTATTNFVSKNKIKYDTKCNSHYHNEDIIKECVSQPSVTTEEQCRFDEFFSLHSPVSLKSRQMKSEENVKKLPNFNGLAAINHPLIKNTGNIPSNSNKASNQVQTTRVGGESVVKDVDLRKQVNKFEFTKTSKQTLNGSKILHICTKDEIARKREEALKKRHKLT